MDCNNYSYTSTSTKCNVVAESSGDVAERVTMERCINFFGDHFYYVSDLFGNIEPLTFDIDTSGGWETERLAYRDAARYYNSLVTDPDRIPCF